MTTKTKKVDVAIVGAGIAGTHLAQLLAKAQIKVALIDRSPLLKSGPQWINAVPLWMFEEAGLAPPEAAEIFDINDQFILEAPQPYKSRVIINKLGVADIHMGFLGERLKKALLINGSKYADFISATIKTASYDQKGRLIEISGHDEKNLPCHIHAKLFVDAAGIKGILRKTHPQQYKWPTLAKADTCVAAQQTLQIIDRYGAQNFLEQNKLEPTNILAQVGFCGGYSLLRMQIDKELNTISLLCGTRALPQFKSAQAILADFVQNNPWIGAKIIDGRGAIPISAPYKNLVSPGLALVGDAASQVYSSHGSGIGIGLIAAKILSNTIIEAMNKGYDIGEIYSLRGYQKTFNKKYYLRLMIAYWSRKLTQNLNEKNIARLMDSGLLSPAIFKKSLIQH